MTMSFYKPLLVLSDNYPLFDTMQFPNMFFNFLWKQVKYKKKYAKCNKMGNFLNLIFKPTNWCEKMSVSKRMIPARLFKNLQKNNQASSSWMLLGKFHCRSSENYINLARKISLSLDDIQ
jgi:hypothetical protein